jgi:hypothetical protein
MAERVEERVYVDRGTSGLGLILGFLVVVAIVVGVLWATGSLSVRHEADGRVEISVDPSQAEHASDNVIKKTGQTLEKAGKQLQNH